MSEEKPCSLTLGTPQWILRLFVPKGSPNEGCKEGGGLILTSQSAQEASKHNETSAKKSETPYHLINSLYSKCAKKKERGHNKLICSYLIFKSLR